MKIKRPHIPVLVGITIFLFVFLFYPLAYVFKEALLPGGSFSLAFFRNLLANPIMREAIANSFMLAKNAQDEVPYDTGWLDEEMIERGRVMVNGGPSMIIYGRDEATPAIDAECERSASSTSISRSLPAKVGGGPT